MYRIGAGIRMAITAALVMTYFAFFASLATSERGRAKIEAEVGQQLWNNFTYLVGGVILFHFGASTASEIKQHVKGASSTNPSRADATGPADRPSG